MRVLKLETDFLQARKPAAVRRGIFMLPHAAPMEWGNKKDIDEPTETPIQQLYRELSGKVLRPVEDPVPDP